MDTKNIDDIWKEMEENDRKIRETYKKKIKGRTSLNTLTRSNKKKLKKKPTATYRFGNTSQKSKIISSKQQDDMNQGNNGNNVLYEDK